jgi:hypothetical protein
MDHRHDRRRPWQDLPQTACLATIKMTSPRHSHTERGNTRGTIDAVRPENSRAESVWSLYSLVGPRRVLEGCDMA